MADPSTADCIWSVFQFMLMVTSLYGLKSTPLTEPVVPVPDPELELALGLGLGLGPDPEPPVQEPSDVHGCPEPLPPLLVLLLEILGLTLETPPCGCPRDS